MKLFTISLTYGGTRFQLITCWDNIILYFMPRVKVKLIETRSSLTAEPEPRIENSLLSRMKNNSFRPTNKTLMYKQGVTPCILHLPNPCPLGLWPPTLKLASQIFLVINHNVGPSHSCTVRTGGRGILIACVWAPV